MNGDLLSELRTLYESRKGMSRDQGERWVSRVSEILLRIAPAEANEFDQLAPMLSARLSDQTVGPIWERMCAVVRAGIARAERDEAVAAAPGQRASKIATMEPNTVDEGSAIDVEELTLRDVSSAMGRLKIGSWVWLLGVLSAYTAAVFALARWIP